MDAIAALRGIMLAKESDLFVSVNYAVRLRRIWLLHDVGLDVGEDIIDLRFPYRVGEA